MNKYLAEFIGTFLLVLVGTGAIAIHDTIWAIGNLGIAIAFGGIVCAMIYMFGRVSGAHINPAVSIAFWSKGDLPKKLLVPYLLVQILAAICASLVLLAFFPSHKTLGTTLPIDNWQTAFILELLLTFALMLVILIFSQTEKIKKYTAIAVGATVGLEAYFAGPYTGASMNPARSIGPALVSGTLEHLWVYIISTILGALLGLVSWLAFK